MERAQGGWAVTLDDGTTTTYESVFVANGHHWDPRWPEPPFPGEFDGEETHAHHYKTPEGYEGKNVLVLGIGNSACDIAVETSRVSNQTFLAMRRGAWVIPKYFGSTPSDELAPEWLSAFVPVRGPASALHAPAAEDQRPPQGLRAARARPQARRGAPHDLVRPATGASATAA